MADLTLNGVRKSYSALEVIHGIDLAVRSGEFIVFVGPSGCGKSTLLRMIAGLESISSGDIDIDGQIVNDVPSPKRGIAMVFQSYALYPHMTVFENMAFGLKLAKTPKQEIERRVHDAARILQIEPYLERMPKALSGGQRQRVAIGRAIVRNPKIFLFDEPLSNLDAALRAQTRVEIAKLHNTLKATMIYVTHDQVEAMTLADRIVVLNKGQIEQVGTPLELYRQPANTFVAGFIAGQRMNFIPVAARKNGSETRLIFSNDKSLVTGFPGADRATSVGLRPEHLVQTDEHSALFSGRLDIMEQFGEYALAYLTLKDGTQITAKLDGAPDIPSDAILNLAVKDQQFHMFDDAGRALRGELSAGTV